MTDRSLRWTLVVLVAAAAFAHAPSLKGGFIYDDFRFVVRNTALVDASVVDIVTDAATHTADDDRDVYRPVRTLSHAFDRRRWDLEPFGFRLHNLLVHLLNVALGVLVIRRLLADAGWFSVWAGAGLLAVHPIGVEVVGFISSRGDLYALSASLLALLVVTPVTDPRYVRPLGAARLVGAALLAFVAALSKESALVLPAIAAWHGWVVQRTRPGRAVFALTLGAAGAFVLRQVALAGLSPIQTTPHGGDVISQIGWAFYGLSRVVEHLVLPQHLSVDYPQFAWAQGTTVWAEPRTWIFFVACALPLALARKFPRWAFAAGWCLIAYLPSSSLLVTLRSLVNDRYAYPALLPFGVAVALGVGAILRDDSRERRRGSISILEGLGIALAIVLGLWWTGMTRIRSEVFTSNGALWEDTREKNPASVPALIGLAAWELDVFQATRAPDSALRRRALLEKAVAIAPPGTMLEGWALGELGEHLLRIEGNPEAALTPLFQSLQIARSTRDRDAPESDEVLTAFFLAEAHAMLGHYDQADSVLRYSLADQVGLASDATALLAIKRAQLAFQRLGDDSSAAAIGRAGQALLDAERHAADNPLVVAMREVWNEIEARPKAATPRPPSEDEQP